MPSSWVMNQKGSILVKVVQEAASESAVNEVMKYWTCAEDNENNKGRNQNINNRIACSVAIAY
jgi:hypothetical protein